MSREYETKVLDISVEEIDDKLINLGAKKLEKFYKIWSHKIDSFDSPYEEHVRLRDEGDKITLAYKKKDGKGIDNTEEIEFEVSSFELAREFLSKFKFNGVFYQERKRWMYELQGVEFAIDFWPKIPAFLEIEAKSERKVHDGLLLLDLVGEDKGNMSIIKVYNKYGMDLHGFKVLKF